MHEVETAWRMYAKENIEASILAVKLGLLWKDKR